MTSRNNKPMSRDRLADIRARTDMFDFAARDLLAEVERLHSREAEWDSKEQALQKSIAEHERVIAKLEAHIDESAYQQQRLIGRLIDALAIARAVAEAPIEVGTVGKSQVRFLFMRDDVRRLQERAQAVIAQEV